MHTDPIADMLTRIRNACIASHLFVEVPFSKLKKELAYLLKDEGYISEVEEIEDDKKKTFLKIKLKYVNGEQVINGIKRISKPGLRIYSGYKELPRVLGGFGIAILSTSKGIITDRKARFHKVGGEVLCYVW
jgi:small subunit ribosomal protein S8